MEIPHLKILLPDDVTPAQRETVKDLIAQVMKLMHDSPEARANSELAYCALVSAIVNHALLSNQIALAATAILGAAEVLETHVAALKKQSLN